MKSKSKTYRKCFTTISKPAHLNRHTAEVHLKLISFKCVECGSIFKRKEYLTEHLKDDGCTENICDKCSQTLMGKQKLRQHVEEVCATLKCSKCEICAKEFRSVGCLQHYLNKKICVGNICGQCNQTFPSKLILSEHIWKVHTTPNGKKLTDT